MKRISCWVVALGLWAAAPGLMAQDATEARLNELNGRISALEEGMGSLKKQLSELSREVDNLRQSLNQPNASYASREELAKLAQAIKEVDANRVQDWEKMRSELASLGKTITAATKPVRSKEPAESSKPTKPESGYKYTIQKGDTLSVIVQAYRDKNVLITVDQVLKANPGLKADRLKVGEEIFIPAPER